MATETETKRTEATPLGTLPIPQRAGKTGDFVELLETIDARIWEYAEIHESQRPDSDADGCDEKTLRCLWCRDKFGEFMGMVHRYITWARPENWGVDFIDTCGAFGIIFYGPYTCLVQMDRNGHVSGHS